MASEVETNTGKVIILSGPVGAGKTTVARALIKLLPQPLSYIEGDTFWSFIAKSEDRTVRDNFPVLIRSMTAAAVPLARSGYDVLLDFSVPPQFLPTARKILKEVPLDYVALLPTEAECAHRAANRAEGKIADYAPLHHLYNLFGEAGHHAIPDDGADARSIAERIRDGLLSGTFRVV